MTDFSGDYTVTVQGLDKLQKLANASPIVKDELKTAMSKAVVSVEAEVKPLVPVGVSGRLRNSIGSRVDEVGSEVRGVVGSSIKEVYPLVMEFGRKPGRMPPPSALERWVYLKLRVPAEQVKAVAFQVARAIGRRGIKGKFFMKRGFEQAKPRITGYFDTALKNVVDRLVSR